MLDTLTFHSVRLIAVSSWRHSGVMLRGAVVFVPGGNDGGICSVYVHNLANTWTWQLKEETTSRVLFTIASYRCAQKKWQIAFGVTSGERTSELISAITDHKWLKLWPAGALPYR